MPQGYDSNPTLIQAFRFLALNYCFQVRNKHSLLEVPGNIEHRDLIIAFQE
jgi:hypothetical protein